MKLTKTDMPDLNDAIFLIGRDSVPSRIAPATPGMLRLCIVVLPGTSCTQELEIDLNVPGTEVDVAGLYICKETDKVTLRVNVNHNVPGCSSRQLFKGLASGQSRTLFDGRILVAHGAAGTKAFQENHSLLLSPGAVVESRPQLEIYADDVECSHGATAGSLDQNQQFYMQSRGIPYEEALRLQKISFLAPILRRLPDSISESVLNSL